MVEFILLSEPRVGGSLRRNADTDAAHRPGGLGRAGDNESSAEPAPGLSHRRSTHFQRTYVSDHDRTLYGPIDLVWSAT
jgi:hypothetical protein